MRRHEPELAGEFRKDPKYEDFLYRLNETLGPLQDSEYQQLPDQYPTVHVIGPPRSGTTLAVQLLCAHLDVGFINNLAAAFWRAPVYGIRLARRLIPENPGISYKSAYGRTKGIHEPHEFGYFWSRLLRYDIMAEKPPGHDDEIDWDEVRTVMTNMTHAMEAPIVFKSPLVGWHIQRMSRALPRTCFVIVRRDPLCNAVSLLRLRREYYGSVDVWGNMKPLQYEQLRETSVFSQIVGQLYHLERAVDEQIDRIGGRNVIRLTYEDLCADPNSALRRVRELLKANGADVQFRDELPDSFEPAPLKGDPRDIERLREEVARFYGSAVADRSPSRSDR